MMPLKIAILASGDGTNAQAIIDKAKAGLLDVKIELLFSNKPHAHALERAQKANIPTEMLDHRQYPDRLSFDLALVDLLHQYDCEIIVLAGYMRLLSTQFLNAFKGHVLNIHPALLPSFPGTHGAQDAMDYGVQISGASVHFVEEQMDSGPLIIQAAVPVKYEEGLEALKTRIHVLEHRIYPQALQWLAEDRIVHLDGRHVVIKPGKRKCISAESDWLVWPPLEEGF